MDCEKRYKERPKSQHGERFVKVKATLWTWTAVEDTIEFDTFHEVFLIPQGYQLDTKVIDWEYLE